MHRGGNTALMLAAVTGRIEILAMLLQVALTRFGPTQALVDFLNVRNDSGLTAVEYTRQELDSPDPRTSILSMLNGALMWPAVASSILRQVPTLPFDLVTIIVGYV